MSRGQAGCRGRPAAIAGSLLARDKLAGGSCPGLQQRHMEPGCSSCGGAGIVWFASSPGEDYRGFVRCPGLRDPAQARPEDV